MTTFESISFVLMVLGLAAGGWFCVFRTSILVTWARKNYEGSKIARAQPFSNMIMKPWYPMHIRGVGIFAWLLPLALVYLGALR
jgi:hypothetical protein